jgi:hypothetical protein
MDVCFGVIRVVLIACPLHPLEQRTSAHLLGMSGKCPLSDSCTAPKAPCGITSSARARNVRVEELARIIAANALIAMRGMKYAQ